MMDQAQKLRQMFEDNTSDKKAHLITVSSGKGGVGKSNFVVNLSIKLQKMGKSVLIFDADVGMGNDDVLMGFFPKYNIFDVIFNEKNINDVIVEGPFGVKIISGGTGLSRFEEISEEQRNSFLDKLSEMQGYDYIIMDTGAGINRNVLGFIACCQDLIIVTTPEPTSLTDSYSLIKAVDHFKITKDVKLVINRAFNEDEAISTFNRLNNVIENFLDVKPVYLGKIAEDRKVVEAVRNQEPFIAKYPDCSASCDISDIASKITGIYNIDNGEGLKSLFKKLFNIFHKEL